MGRFPISSRNFSGKKKIEKNFAVLQNKENVGKTPNIAKITKNIYWFFGKFSGNRKCAAKISALSKTAQCAIVQNIETMEPPDGRSPGNVMVRGKAGELLLWYVLGGSA